MDVEPLSKDAFDDRLANLAESARLTGSTASLLVAATRLKPMKECMENFEQLYDNGINHLTLPLPEI